MKMKNVLKLSAMYCFCPKCGSDELGEGEGSLIVDEYTFHRKCKCGFDIIVDERNDEI
ncbi:DUF3797 domain-containing protein [Clostridioides difficile]|uniref:DUF3797 domain-containing protein n=3 Tax=Leicestervirus CD382 TaxID=2843973 RepID=A0A1J1J8Z9_9CAUD